MGSYSSALIPDTEEFVSVVSVTEKLNEHAAHAVDERLQSELRTLGTKTVPTESFSSLLPKAISAVLHPAPPAGINSHSQPSRNPEGHASPNLEQLQTELRDLKGQFEQMKTQHNKEIKLLMNELDEEKRIRLTLQMEIQRMKKHMSK
ncbi:TatD DNase family protein [Sarotherodon galilaeus]